MTTFLHLLYKVVKLDFLKIKMPRLEAGQCDIGVMSKNGGAGGTLSYLFLSSVDYFFTRRRTNGGAWRIIEGLDLPFIQHSDLCHKTHLFLKHFRSIFSGSMRHRFVFIDYQICLWLFNYQILPNIFQKLNCFI